MTKGPAKVSAKGVGFSFVPDCGIVSSFQVRDQDRLIDMMHRAPWLDDPDSVPPNAPPHLGRLEGDFFCAPFGGLNAEGAPLHGWPANSHWTEQDRPDAFTIRYALDHPVMGSSLIKELSLQDHHPFLYQRHIFTGGNGAISAANHAMISLPNGGLLRFSQKSWFETLSSPLEDDPSRGRSCLFYPARSADPRRFPGADGGTVDLTSYPFGPSHEDFVIAVEAPESPLGWIAVTRPQEGDLYLSLRNPKRLPMTMLWHSNGGRDYAPWSGRHFGCLGVEEGIAANMLGVTGADAEDVLSRAGQATAIHLRPDRTTEVRHITGTIAWPSGEAVQNIGLLDGFLAVQGESGARRMLPIRSDFLEIPR